MSTATPGREGEVYKGEHFKRIIITKDEFSDCFFRGCKIRDAILSECFIDDSSLENCKLVRSDVGVHQHPFDNTFYDSSARDCEMTECTLTNVDVRRSLIVNRPWDLNSLTPGRRLYQCRLQTSQIESDPSSKCSLTKCKVFAYNAHKSTLLDCELELKTGESIWGTNIWIREFIIKNTPLAFEKFPPEIRIIIFAEALRDTWAAHRPRIPALLAAIRADPQLYREAFDIFGSLHNFKLSREN